MITTNCRGCGWLGDCDDAELCEQCATDPEIVGEYADDGGCLECGAGGGGDPYGECAC
jgi:hypothetical protein